MMAPVTSLPHIIPQSKTATALRHHLAHQFKLLGRSFPESCVEKDFDAILKGFCFEIWIPVMEQVRMMCHPWSKLSSTHTLDVANSFTEPKCLIFSL